MALYKISKSLFLSLFLPIFSVFLSVFFAVLISPSFRIWIQDQFISSHRKVLSVLSGRIELGSPQEYSFIKFSQGKAIYVEIRQGDKLQQTLKIPDFQDASIQFQGQTSNLILVDLDKDGYNELLVPTYDVHLDPRVHEYRWSAEKGLFQELPSP